MSLKGWLPAGDCSLRLDVPEPWTNSTRALAGEFIGFKNVAPRLHRPTVSPAWLEIRRSLLLCAKAVVVINIINIQMSRKSDRIIISTVYLKTMISSNFSVSDRSEVLNSYILALMCTTSLINFMGEI